MNRKILLMKLM